MIIPVVTGDLDPAALEDLIRLSVHYHHARAHAASSDQPEVSEEAGQSAPAVPADPAGPAARTAHGEALAALEEQILARVIQIVSGPGGIASFLRRNLLGHGMGGPPLPLDAGQTDEIPVHLQPWPPSATRAASSPAAATSPPPPAHPATSATAPTADPPAWPTSRTTAGGTTTSSSTSSAGP